MSAFSWEVFESSEVFKTLRKLTEQPAEAYSSENGLQEIHGLVMAEVAKNRGKSLLEVNGSQVRNEGKPMLAGAIPDSVADVLVELACRTPPSDQRRLVEFASQLYRRTEIDPESGEPLTQDGKAVWAENVSLLRSANTEWRDRISAEENGGAWNIKTYSDDVGLPSDIKRRWANLMAFTAQLTQLAPPVPEYDDNPIHWAHMAIWSLRAAFEADIAPHELVGTTTFHVACLWFIYAADAVWACALKEIEAGGEFMSSPGSQYQEKAWKGFNQERWDTWVRALETAGTSCSDSDAETKDMIDGALKKAKNASQGN
ncbi:hypothetical protein JX266_011926 [Neoarthrinium moseri]|uniref:uncharacterized protein n=1 Tax=Neoarthrinium moseri TaxID=1658444 RepID=UPI001FDB6051|nr:uncharacterized protein JN550_010592 [Neoarthrinium moseri]KAI1841848.1 hypothetical protein JX266_011926 [Neoarthrinium moseri]KAI1861961.1 hypothetical protein JN550_010592 [Neoarthrinium moseri]